MEGSKLFSMGSENLNLVLRIIVIMKIYSDSLKDENWDNTSYKGAVIIGILAVASGLLIKYSTIISLKYQMNHYDAVDTVTMLDKLNLFGKYLLLSCIGVVLTVVPTQLIEMLRLLALTGSYLVCCGNKVRAKINESFDASIEYLTGLNLYQVTSLQFTNDMTKITYEDFIYLLL